MTATVKYNGESIIVQGSPSEIKQFLDVIHDKNSTNPFYDQKITYWGGKDTGTSNPISINSDEISIASSQWTFNK